MTWRKAHGNARRLGALVVVEGAPVDELPPGTPAEPTGPVARRPDGTVDADGARALGRLGGLRTAERKRFAAQLADQLGLADVGEHLQPYIGAAREFAEAHLCSLAATVGGGTVGPGPASAIQSAALALASSRWLYSLAAQTGDPKHATAAARLADQSRTALLTAHELAAREAQARPRASAADRVTAAIIGRRPTE